MTWGEFWEWVHGNRMAQYGLVAKLLRQIAYQQISLSPYIDKVDKPYSVTDYMIFPTDPKPRKIEYIDPKELARLWKVQD